MKSTARHFRTAAEFRVWLEQNHATATELTLLFYNKSSGRGGMTYAEALDEALCFGWIDGLLHKLDAESHTRRFTPRRPGSNWSRINVAHVERLSKAGRMQEAGVKAFAARKAERTGVYSFENRPEKLPRELEAPLRKDAKAWAFWLVQPAGYRRVAIWWVVSAKKADTRERRLRELMALCRAGQRLWGK